MKTTHLLSTLILTVCLGFGSVMAQNAAPQVCPEKAEKPCKVKLTPEQRMEAQAQRMGKQLMLDDAKLAQFTSLYKEYLTALKECRPAAKENYCCPIKILRSYKIRADFICEVSPFSLDFSRQTIKSNHGQKYTF